MRGLARPPCPGRPFAPWMGSPRAVGAGGSGPVTHSRHDLNRSATGRCFGKVLKRARCQPAWGGVGAPLSWSSPADLAPTREDSSCPRVAFGAAEMAGSTAGTCTRLAGRPWDRYPYGVPHGRHAGSQGLSLWPQAGLVIPGASETLAGTQIPHLRPGSLEPTWRAPALTSSPYLFLYYPFSVCSLLFCPVRLRFSSKIICFKVFTLCKGTLENMVLVIFDTDG